MTTTPLASIGIDIGKEVFHVVGFGTDGKIAFVGRISKRGSKYLRTLFIQAAKVVAAGSATRAAAHLNVVRREKSHTGLVHSRSWCRAGPLP